MKRENQQSQDSIGLNPICCLHVLDVTTLVFGRGSCSRVRAISTELPLGQKTWISEDSHRVWGWVQRGGLGVKSATERDYPHLSSRQQIQLVHFTSSSYSTCFHPGGELAPLNTHWISPWPDHGQPLTEKARSRSGPLSETDHY